MNVNPEIIKNLLQAKGNQFQFRKEVISIAELILHEYISSSYYNEVNNESTRRILIPILRAGIYFLPVFEKINPTEIHFIDAKRKGNSIKEIRAEITYKTFKDVKQDAGIVYILEPMLATFSTMSECLDLIIRAFSPKEIIIFSAFMSEKANNEISKYNKGLITNFSLMGGLCLDERGYILIPDPWNKGKFITLDFGDECSGTTH